MELSKAFDVMSHDLLIAKLAVYGIGYSSLKLLYSYLTNRQMRVRVGAAFSEWLEIKLGVSQGSILGPLLFNIFLNDIFFCDLHSLIANFADDNTLSTWADSIDGVMRNLYSDVPTVVDWFISNQMVINPDKFQFFVLGCNDIGNHVIVINGYTVTSSITVKLIGVTIDNMAIDIF